MDKLTTYGATRAKLIANGYAPCSAFAPGVYGYRVADDPGAILCTPQHEGSPLPDADDRQLAVFIVTVQDKELRAEVVAILAKHGLSSGPYRIGSDGTAAYVTRWAGYDLALNRETSGLTRGDDPAVELAGVERTDNPEKIFTSATIRLDGDWKGGSPLSVPRTKLPVLDSGKLEAAWSEINKLINARAEAPPEVPQYLREHYEAGVYKRMDFVAPVYETETPPPKSAIRRWYDGITREWVESR